MEKLKIISIVLLVMVLGFSFQAYADSVPWSYFQYTVGNEETGSQTGTPPSIIRLMSSRSWGVAGPNHMHVDCWDCNSFIAYSYFQGQYTATSTTFQFNYTLRNFGPNPDGWYDGVYDPYGSFSFGITVEDLTDSTILYSGLPTDTSDTISVSTPIGNDINVFVYMEFSMTGNAWLDHSTAVVPEPVSTTLFLVGSATLGFRQWRKKRAA